MAESAQRKLERKLAAVYSEARNDLQKKLDDYIVKFRARDAQKKADLASGTITQEEYDSWLKGAVFQGKMWRARVKQMTDSMAAANEESLRLIRGQQLDEFAAGFNHEQYVLEQNTGLAVNFGLYDTETVQRLIREEPELLPRKKLDKSKDGGWNRKQIAGAVTQGILQGESIDQIARRIARDTAQRNDKAMIRYARTATTSAQNAGRIETMRRATAMGISCKKKWMATLDGRTRDAHAALDGQVADIDEPFKSELGDIMFPGDPSAAAGNVYNCRCTLVYVYPNYPAEAGERLDNVTGEHVRGDMTYAEWAGQQMPPPDRHETDAVQELKDLITAHSGPWDEKSLQTVGKKAAEAIAQRRGKGFEEVSREFDAATEEADRLFSEFRQARDKYREALAYHDPDLQEKRDRYDSASRAYSAARQKALDAAAKRDGYVTNIVRGIVSEVRQVGGVTEANKGKYMQAGRRSKTTDALIEAFNCYPTDWIRLSGSAGISLKPKWTQGRAYYAPRTGEIRISDRKGSNIHELGHRFEYAIPGILEAERTFYARRTAGEDLKWLGSGYGYSERTRRDKFISAYMGKDYGGDAYELVSMGFQMAFTEYDKLSQDEDMRDWILGLLLCL